MAIPLTAATQLDWLCVDTTRMLSIDAVQKANSRHPGGCVIPEAGTPRHVRDNVGALHVTLREDDVLELDAAAPPPPRPVALEVA